VFIEITQDSEGNFKAEVGATEVRIQWPNGYVDVTKSLGFNCVAPTMEEALNQLGNLYYVYMLKPHERKLRDYTENSPKLEANV
jgi:hypothetical protein